jgi:hypothetical protein
MSEADVRDNELCYKVWRVAVIENIAIYIAIALCTASVAYFAQSADGLWSLLLLLAINSPQKKEEK